MTLHGRVGSLLGAGTGFHSQLTGLGNILPHGAILGMTKKEVKPRFERDCSLCGSRMFPSHSCESYGWGYMFDWPCHGRPPRAEILIADEVLAVGHAALQIFRQDARGEWYSRADRIVR